MIKFINYLILGEIKYTIDEPHHPGQLTGRFLQSERANAAVVSVDTAAALVRGTRDRHSCGVPGCLSED